MQNDFFKIIGIIIVCFFIIYIVVKMFHLQATVVEGLTSSSTTTNDTTTTTDPSNGEAGMASSYAAAIKSKTVKLQDELLISKYRNDYEKVLINLDDYLGYYLLQQILNMKLVNPNDLTNYCAKISYIKNAKDSLDTVMTFLDKQ
jgi:hypothetical protein